MATIPTLISKYRDLQEHEEVRLVKALYSSVVRDLEGLDIESEQERSKRLLNEELRALERSEGSKNDLRCKRCGLPGANRDEPSSDTGEKGVHLNRRLLPAAGGGLVCGDCI